MTREAVIRMAREAGFAHIAMDKMPEKFERFAAMVAAAERKKHQADIELWKGEAAKAEKWRAMALAKDPMQPGTAVQEIQREAMELERVACASACDALVDVKEEARIQQRVNEALQQGDEEDQLQAMRHQLTVSTFNAGIKSCASAIRARSKP